jgi:hypothetical protein
VNEEQIFLPVAECCNVADYSEIRVRYSTTVFPWIKLYCSSFRCDEVLTKSREGTKCFHPNSDIVLDFMFRRSSILFSASHLIYANKRAVFAVFSGWHRACSLCGCVCSAQRDSTSVSADIRATLRGTLHCALCTGLRLSFPLVEQVTHAFTLIV